MAFDAVALAPELDRARLVQGQLLGLMDATGLAQAQEVRRDLWVQEAMATAAIEGERLTLESVRSSVAHRLGLADAPSHDRQVEGLVLVMQDAMENHQSPLDLDRLCRWQAALFPGGTSGLGRIAVGRLRDHADAMQMVSGPLGRALVDMAHQMLSERAAYYEASGQMQNVLALGAEGITIDVTPWVQWFVRAFTQACLNSQATVRQAVDMSAFRLQAAQAELNVRQHKVLGRLLEAGSAELAGGFLGGMTSDKYAKMTGASKTTASRELADLLAKGLLRVQGVGKATRYALNVPGWNPPA